MFKKFLILGIPFAETATTAGRISNIHNFKIAVIFLFL